MCSTLQSPRLSLVSLPPVHGLIPPTLTPAQKQEVARYATTSFPVPLVIVSPTFLFLGFLWPLNSCRCLRRNLQVPNASPDRKYTRWPVLSALRLQPLALCVRV